jgi:hypothetical protein
MESLKGEALPDHLSALHRLLRQRNVVVLLLQNANSFPPGISGADQFSQFLEIHRLLGSRNEGYQ